MKKIINVNLLPYRENNKKEKQKHFYTLSGLAVGLGVVVVAAFYSFVSYQVDYQKQKNEEIVKYNKEADKNIEKIKVLQEELKESIERKKIVESLQLDRDEMVHLLDVFVIALPETLSLQSVKQSGKKITITGITPSNAKVALFMDNLEKSEFLEKANIVEIKNISIKKSNKEIMEGKEFTITVNIKKSDRDNNQSNQKDNKAKAK